MPKNDFTICLGWRNPNTAPTQIEKFVKRNRKRAFWEPPRRIDHRDRCTFRYRYQFLQSKLVFQSEQSLPITLHPVPIPKLLTSRAYATHKTPLPVNKTRCNRATSPFGKLSGNGAGGLAPVPKPTQPWAPEHHRASAAAQGGLVNSKPSVAR